MAKRKPPISPASDESTNHHDVFALDNVTQLREAVDQAVYGDSNESKLNEQDRAQTVEGLTTLGQMGLLTEMDIEEARKGYL